MIYPEPFHFLTFTELSSHAISVEPSIHVHAHGVPLYHISAVSCPVPFVIFPQF